MFDEKGWPGCPAPPTSIPIVTQALLTPLILHKTTWLSETTDVWFFLLWGQGFNPSSCSRHWVTPGVLAPGLLYKSKWWEVSWFAEDSRAFRWKDLADSDCQALCLDFTTSLLHCMKLDQSMGPIKHAVLLTRHLTLFSDTDIFPNTQK